MVRDLVKNSVCAPDGRWRGNPLPLPPPPIIELAGGGRGVKIIEAGPCNGVELKKPNSTGALAPFAYRRQSEPELRAWMLM